MLYIRSHTRLCWSWQVTRKCIHNNAASSEYLVHYQHVGSSNLFRAEQEAQASYRDILPASKKKKEVWTALLHVTTVRGQGMHGMAEKLHDLIRPRSQQRKECMHAHLLSECYNIIIITSC